VGEYDLRLTSWNSEGDSLTAYKNISLTTVGIAEKNSIPQCFGIDVYPNPFNSSVVITVETQNLASLPEIAIYDVMGNVVATPFGACAPLSPLLRGTNEQSASGASRGFIWQPDENIPSGIFLVKATTQDGQTITKRIVYLK
ncbi:hypothetical protein DRQ26_05770, partial [bacterium]